MNANAKEFNHPESVIFSDAEAMERAFRDAPLEEEEEEESEESEKESESVRFSFIFTPSCSILLHFYSISLYLNSILLYSTPLLLHCYSYSAGV